MFSHGIMVTVGFSLAHKEYFYYHNPPIISLRITTCNYKDTILSWTCILYITTASKQALFTTTMHGGGSGSCKIERLKIV